MLVRLVFISPRRLAPASTPWSRKHEADGYFFWFDKQ